MRYVAAFCLSVVFSQALFAQPSINCTVSNGVHFQGVGQTNPAIYGNDLLTPKFIFNRFGQKFYETTSAKNNWNGTVDRKPLQEDAYYYNIRLSNTDIKGAVRIVR